jgi:hypothetical protein
MTETTTPELIALLRRRLEIIADHSWRDRDSAGHLDALKAVSMEIQHWTDVHRHALDARLRHFLTNASFDKALAHLTGGP